MENGRDSFNREFPIAIEGRSKPLHWRKFNWRNVLDQAPRAVCYVKLRNEEQFIHLRASTEQQVRECKFNCSAPCHLQILTSQDYIKHSLRIPI